MDRVWMSSSLLCALLVVSPAHALGQTGGILNAELLAHWLADRQAEPRRQRDQGHHDRERMSQGENNGVHDEQAGGLANFAV